MNQRRLEEERDQSKQDQSNFEMRAREREAALEVQVHNMQLEGTRLQSRITVLEVCIVFFLLFRLF